VVDVQSYIWQCLRHEVFKLIFNTCPTFVIHGNAGVWETEGRSRSEIVQKEFGIHFAIDLIAAASYEQMCRTLLNMPSCDKEKCRRVTDKARELGLPALLPQASYPRTWVHTFAPRDVEQKWAREFLLEHVLDIINRANKEDTSDFEWGVACMRTGDRYNMQTYMLTYPGKASIGSEAKLRLDINSYPEVRDHLYHWGQDLCRIHGDPFIDGDRRCQKCVDEEEQRIRSKRTHKITATKQAS